MRAGMVAARVLHRVLGVAIAALLPGGCVSGPPDPREGTDWGSSMKARTKIITAIGGSALLLGGIGGIAAGTAGTARRRRPTPASQGHRDTVGHPCRPRAHPQATPGPGTSGNEGNGEPVLAGARHRRDLGVRLLIVTLV